tara:strand:- start:72 stop:449 length:378 start_codon:yes stop_codon:yes gene_type:complete
MEEQSKTLKIESLLVNTGSVPHEIEIDPENQPGAMLTVWLKEMSFIDMQQAVKEFISFDANTGEVEMDLASYWRYMFMTCIDKTEPSMSKTQLLALRPEVAIHISTLLPQPQDMVVDPLASGTGE